MPTIATANTPAKQASPDYPIHKLLAERWSPYGFADKPVAVEDLRSLFEAARWAASSYNEQPWAYVVALRENPAEFERLLSCLVPANQSWAKAAPVLVLGVVSLKFTEPKRTTAPPSTTSAWPPPTSCWRRQRAVSRSTK